MIKPLIFGAAMLIALPSIAHAQFVISGDPKLVCGRSEVYDASHREGAPPLVGKALAALSGPSAKLGFAVCKNAYGNLHYFLRQPRPNRHGVCRQYEEEIFPVATKAKQEDGAVFYLADDGITRSLGDWTIIAPGTSRERYFDAIPQEFALLAVGDCPPVSDPRYISVSQITDGMLKAFDAHWRRAIRSQEAFDTAFAKLRLRMGNDPETSLKDMWEMETRLRAAALQGKVSFTNLSCPDDNDGCIASTNLGIFVGFDTSETGAEFVYLLPTFIP